MNNHVVFYLEAVTIMPIPLEEPRKFMKRIFYPNSIVVIGVSERPDNLARNIIANLKTFEYQGDLYAVGREPGQIYGVPIVDSLDQVPDNLDLAVILTPAAIVPSFIDVCGQKGIQRVVVESGGFSEFSEEGRRLEEEILRIIDKWDMRLVGPNCISVVNLETGVCLPFAPISKNLTRLGAASVIAQSGGVSITYMAMLSIAGVGTNKVVSIGNKADLDETDYLEYLIDDPGTEMICLYLESISRGRRLLDQAQTSTKPIIIHKANRTQASQSVAYSHTAALAADDRIVDAAFKQAGIQRAEGFRDLVAIAQGLTLPPVKGKDLVIISRSGGHAVAAADAAERHGFHLPPLPESFINTVHSYYKADVIALTNPLDLGVIFDFNIYAQIVEQCLRALSPDAILLINTYTHAEEMGAVQLGHRVAEIVHQTNLPIAFCVYADIEKPGEMQQDIGLSVFDDIEAALRALASSREWYRNVSAREEHVAFESIHGSMMTTKPLESTSSLPIDRAFELCQKYHIPTARWRLAHSEEDALSTAEEIGFPIALKLSTTEISHKTDVGGVRLGIKDRKTLLTGVNTLQHLASEMGLVEGSYSILVQEMVPPGVELILGGKRDPTFGPIVMFGLGGIQVEIFNDVTFRVAPLQYQDASQMISEVRGSVLLDGLRGRKPINREPIIQALLSISRLMLENDHIVELDINPLIASDDSIFAVDIRALGVS
jgi:acyl-CoA synthetase (NDP forming)